MSKVTVDTRRLNQLIRQSPDNEENFVKSVAFSIERETKINAPLDTGALRNSVYVETQNTNNTPMQKDYTLPRASKNKVYVGPSMEYAIYQEFGTSRMQAQPYFIPAVERVASQLDTHYRLLLP